MVVVVKLPKLIQKVVASGINPDDVTEDALSQHMYTKGIPDPDLVIRSAGENRISNFLIWQTANSVFYSSEVLWPDFGRQQLVEAIKAYSDSMKNMASSDNYYVENNFPGRLESAVMPQFRNCGILISMRK